jgi:hypothetical protein
MNLEDDSVPEIEKIFSGIPVTIQFKDNAIIGWATAHQHKDTGDATIFISLQGDAAKELGDLAKFMEIYSLGFAGVPLKKEPE